VEEDTLEKDRLDMLMAGESAGMTSSDGEGEAERVGEDFAGGTLSVSTIDSVILKDDMVSCVCQKTSSEHGPAFVMNGWAVACATAIAAVDTK
jgi:hypothetical protein